MNWHVYIIECTAKTRRVTVHVGIALDVHKRMGDHRAGRVKATRGRQIVCLGFTSPMNHGAALAMEAMMKQMPPGEKRLFAAKWNGNGGSDGVE